MLPGPPSCITLHLFGAKHGIGLVGPPRDKSINSYLRVVCQMTNRNPAPYRPYPLTERLRGLFCDEIWNIAVVDQSAEDIVRCGLRKPPRWMIPPGRGCMIADPAYRERPDGGRILYAEWLDYRTNVGEIWSAELASGRDLAEAQLTRLLSLPFHASYPFPFEDEEGRLLITAETWQAGEVALWTDERPPRRLGTLVAGYSILDPTLYRAQDARWWLFCGLHDVDPNGALFLFYAKSPIGPWTAHPGNPVKIDRAGSRPAGPLFWADGRLIRPAQDCSETYGGAIILHEITRLDEVGFSERVVRRLEPLPGPYSRGLHTLCPAGPQTLIDGKRWRIHLARAARKTVRLANRVFHQSRSHSTHKVTPYSSHL